MKRPITLFAILFALALPLTVYAQHDHHGMQHPAPPSTKAEQKDPIFVAYEEARQALITQSIPDVQIAANHISNAAHDADQHEIAELAADLEVSDDIADARTAFAALSNELIKYRKDRCCVDKPAVVYCSMEKKSWLQPGGEIGNPYVDAAMRRCGVVKEN